MMTYHIKRFFLLMLTFFAVNVHAKKTNYPFEIMIGKADLIVVGQISKVLVDSCYVFKIEQTVKGKCDEKIVVSVFKNWSCDVRWKNAEVGQSLFLFLVKNDEIYKTIGGSDGEIFIEGGKLRLYNIFNPEISKEFSVHNSPKLGDVIISIRNFMACYSLVSAEHYRYSFDQLKSDEEILPYSTENSFSIWLFDRVKIYKNLGQGKTTPNPALAIGRLTEKK